MDVVVVAMQNAYNSVVLKFTALHLHKVILVYSKILPTAMIYSGMKVIGVAALLAF